MADRSGYIGRAPGDSSITVARQTFSPTGVTTDFTFASGYTVGYLDLFLNGTKLIEGVDYNATDSSTISLVSAAINGDVLEGVAYKAFNLGDARRIGIQSGGALLGNVDTLNFVGTGNTFALNGGTIDVSISGGAGAGGTWSNYDSNVGVTTTKKVKIQNNLEVTGVTTSTGGFVGALTGNASSATVLASSRNIGGVAFNGSGDINLPGVNQSGTQNTSGTAAGLTGTPDITVRNIVGVAATFTGVLTYEDVTNIDSVGVVTARTGIKVLAGGINAVGLVTGTAFTGYDYLRAPFSTTVSFTVTVAAKTSAHRYNGTGSSNAYLIDGVQSPFLTLTPGRTYRFVHDNTGSHPLKFYLEADKTTLYSTGVTFNNAYTEITVTDSTPQVLHYQCTNHAYMGNAVNTNSNVAATQPAIGPQFTGISSGSIADGKPVIITADGKVMAISGDSASDTTGSKVAFETDTVNSTHGHGIVYDPDENKVIIAYCNQAQSDKLEYVIGTVSSGQNISFTSPVEIDDGGVNPRLAYDTYSNKLVVAYRDPDNSSYGTARVGTVASGGGSVSWGSAVVYESASAHKNEIVFDSTNNKVVIAYRDQGNSNKGTAIVGNVSGTSISFGTPVVFEAGDTTDIKMAFDENTNKILIIYVDEDNSNYCKSVVGTVSGTSISFGAETTFNANSSEYTTCVYFPPAQKVLCAVRNSSSNIVAKLATISGDSVSFGTAEQITTDDSTSYINQAVYHTYAGKIYTSWRRGSDTYYRIVKYKSTGSNIDFDTAQADTGYDAYYPSFGIYDPDTKQVVISFVDADNSSAGTTYVASVGYTNTNLSSSNFIGISNAAYSNGDTATVQVPGSVDDAQSGLTIGSLYYADPTGILSTSAGNPSVVAGRAVAATKLLISFA